ncbi:uncharacterized protein V1516DRAFT_682399 [Lipomyces oligophaga]|uniref:uncharacterized protein n=1 Tax=Lipomyces oligophaga TaxID=45792 RepID=UPI0034CE0A4A
MTEHDSVVAEETNVRSKSLIAEVTENNNTRAVGSGQPDFGISTVSSGASIKSQQSCTSRRSYRSHRSEASQLSTQKAVNLSVLCPSCSTSIPVDLPFLVVAPSSDEHEFDSEEDLDDSNSGGNVSGHDSDFCTASDTQNLPTTDEIAKQSRIIRQLKLQIDKLNTQIADDHSSISDLQPSRKSSPDLRSRRRSSALRLANLGSISSPAPPQISATTSVAHYISSPIRRESSSSMIGESASSTLSKTKSVSSLASVSSSYINPQNQSFDDPSTSPSSRKSGNGESQSSSTEPSESSTLGIVGRTMSMARSSISYIPFQSALLSASGYGLDTSQQSSSQNSTGLLSSSSSSSTSSNSVSAFSQTSVSTSATTQTVPMAPAESPSPSYAKLCGQYNRLQQNYQKEQAAREAAEVQLSKASHELEELSQSLFEQANEMVAHERRERARSEKAYKERILALELVLRSRAGNLSGKT